jgi:hypothetical protein
MMLMMMWLNFLSCKKKVLGRDTPRKLCHGAQELCQPLCVSHGVVQSDRKDESSKESRVTCTADIKWPDFH